MNWFSNALKNLAKTVTQTVQKAVSAIAPKGPPVSPKLNIPSGTKITQPTPQNQNQLYLAGTQTSPIQKAFQNQQIGSISSTGNFVPSPSFSTTHQQEQSTTGGKNVGDTVYINGFAIE